MFHADYTKNRIDRLAETCCLMVTSDEIVLFLTYKS